MEVEEKEQLLSGEDNSDDSDASPQPPTYDSVLKEPPPPPRNKVVTYFHTHRENIPGYGVIQMIKGVRVYALYVLFMMLMAYLLNQLDRYTLPIVTKEAGYDLKYGDLACMANKTLIDDFDIPIPENVTENITDYCTDSELKHNETLCVSFTYDYNETNYTFCEFAHTGQGIVYQVVAGPVFNNLYPLAGIFTGFLADYGRRTVWLVIALTFWSVVTGVTGFAHQYWQLVVLRALLAIGAAGCTPFAVSILADYFPPEFRGTAMGFYYFGIYIGYSLAFAIGNSITEVLNWRWVFFISALIGIAVAPIILFTVKEPKRTKNPKVDTPADEKITFGRRVLMLLVTFIMPGMVMLCIAGGIRNAGGYVWAYNTQVFFEDHRGFTKGQISKWMSWIPLVGGSLGAIVGGMISDFLVKGRSPYMRIWVLIFSQFLAAPFAAGALFLPYPWCFLSLIPSNVIGEMWVGVTTALVVDLAPSKVRTGAVGLYLFIITVIGGNFNLLVAPIKNGFNKHFGDLPSYQYTLLLTFPGLYVISSGLFIITFFLMKFDLTFKRRREEEGLSVNANEAAEEEENEEIDGGSFDKAV